MAKEYQGDAPSSLDPCVKRILVAEETNVPLR